MSVRDALEMLERQYREAARQAREASVRHWSDEIETERLIRLEGMADGLTIALAVLRHLEEGKR